MAGLAPGIIDQKGMLIIGQGIGMEKKGGVRDIG